MRITKENVEAMAVMARLMNLDHYYVLYCGNKSRHHGALRKRRFLGLFHNSPCPLCECRKNHVKKEVKI
jgi:hypothetical protein